MRKIVVHLLALIVVLGFLAGCATRPAAEKPPAAPAAAAQPAAKPAEPPAAPAVKVDSTPLELTLIHLNDTHSKLEPTQVQLVADLDGSLQKKPVYVELGGFPRVWAAVEHLRRENPNALFLHAGDAFQGTLYFTQFEGKADVDFLNAMKVDALALGNHEFDKGPQLLKSLSGLVRFPVLASNLDTTAEPLLAGVGLKPYTIRTVGGSRVAIIGLTNPETPFISSPGPNLKFLDPAAVVTRAVAEIEAQGVNKIVVLSHQGYREDLALAAAVKGVDVIVGGHSHTLLGSFADLGLASAGPYPTVVKNAAGETVLVATAWEWAKAVGEMDVSFDASGKVGAWSGTPHLVVNDAWARIYDMPGPDGKPLRVQYTKAAGGTATFLEYDGKGYTVAPSPERAAAYRRLYTSLAPRVARDPRFLFVAPKPEGVEKLATYSAGVNALKVKIVAQAAEELKRLNNQGPGPLIAESMLFKTGARIAVMNPGGVRTNLNPGPLSVAQVYELQPFGNTLVTIDLSGTDVVKVLEDMTGYTISRYEKKPDTAFVYVAGVRFTLEVNAAKGQHVNDVQVQKADGAYEPLRPDGTYKVVVNSFMAAGGDMNNTLKAASGKVDTGFIDSEATLEYLQGKTLSNRGEERVRQVF
jgi:5'-nucleotidase